MKSLPNPKVTEVAFAKNEGRFFLEWIAYHRLIGVNDILVYTNDCEDELPALLERLQEMGLVTHVPNSLEPGEQPQNKALSLALEQPLVREADYILQIDPDEFLYIGCGEGRIADLIATAPEADVISIQMRFFGDNGLPRLSEGLVIEQLTGASTEDFELNDIVKSIAKNTPGLFIKVTANHMPGFEPALGQNPRLFNSAGQEIPPAVYGGERFRKMPAAYRSMRCAQLNHYAVKTFSDYRAKKHRGTAANNDKKLTMAYWNARNRNEVQDTRILRYAAGTRALMAQWLRDPVLRARNTRCFEAYEEILKTSETIFESARPAGNSPLGLSKAPKAD